MCCVAVSECQSDPNETQSESGNIGLSDGKVFALSIFLYMILHLSVCRSIRCLIFMKDRLHAITVGSIRIGFISKAILKIHGESNMIRPGS